MKTKQSIVGYLRGIAIAAALFAIMGVSRTAALPLTGTRNAVMTAPHSIQVADNGQESHGKGHRATA